MRNPETQLSVVPSYGIKQRYLPLITDDISRIYTEVTGSRLPNEWIFHHSRIQSELNQGRDGLDINAGSMYGRMTLSVRKNGGLLVFNLDANKDEKPENLRHQYEELENRFKAQVSTCLLELGIAEKSFF